MARSMYALHVCDICVGQGAMQTRQPVTISPARVQTIILIIFAELTFS